MIPKLFVQYCLTVLHGWSTVLIPAHSGVVVRVERLLLTGEARELIQRARAIADKVLDPIADKHEREETYPTGSSLPSEKPGFSASRTRRSGAAERSPTRSTCGIVYLADMPVGLSTGSPVQEQSNPRSRFPRNKTLRAMR